MRRKPETDRKSAPPRIWDYVPGRPETGRSKDGRSRRIVRTAAVVAGTSAIIVAVFLIFRPDDREPPDAAGTTPGTSLAPAVEPGPRVIEDAIQPGETLSDILQDYDFSPAEIDRLVQQVKPVFNLARIIAGRTLKLIVLPDGGFQSIEYPLDENQFLLITKKEADYQAEKKSYPFVLRVAYVDGVIDEHLYGAILAEGEEPGLAIALEQIFGWDVDFYAGLRTGDSFRLIVEKKFLDGRFRRYGNVLAAEFWNDGRRIEAARYEYEDGGKTRTGYFHPDGRSLRKEFLKSPLLSYTRISSRFSSRRLHPIRKVYRAHYGVDYAAPVGTPVYATADGSVEEAGWSGGAGRMIRLSHRSGYETMYLHLSEINVRKGQRVAGGERIGRVGSSGESTGPHLDYRIKRFGSYLNPLSAKFMPVEPLDKTRMPDFQKKAAGFRFLLDTPMKTVSGRF